MPNFYDAQGASQEVKLDLSVYREAAEHGLTVPQLVNRRYVTDAAKYGTAWDQFCASTGLFMREDRKLGIRPPTLAQVLNGDGAMLNPEALQAGQIVREAVPASRIIFPAVFLEAVENQLAADTTGYVSMFDSMVAISDSINGARFEQPVLNYSQPSGAMSQGMSQLALPASMLGITVADVARKIPTFSLGIEISTEALKATTLPLLTMAVARQAEIERATRVDQYVDQFRQGDTDNGTSALSVTTMTSLDSGATAGTLTHKAWVTWLRKNWRKRHINWVMCDLATALKIENRTNRPVITADDPNSPRINPTSQVANPAWQNVQIFMLEDGTIPADIVMGLDSRYGIRRVRNSQAEYTAVEQYVMRKSEALRYDFGEICYRMFDDAWTVLNINA